MQCFICFIARFVFNSEILTAGALSDRYVAQLGDFELVALIKINILSVSSLCAFSRSFQGSGGSGLHICFFQIKA